MTVFTGQPRYVEKKILELAKRGYRIVKRHIHPDQSITITMER